MLTESPVTRGLPTGLVEFEGAGSGGDKTGLRFDG